MKLSVTFADASIAQDSLQILRQIGQGSFQVYQAFSASQNKTYALKAFPKNSFGTTQYKKEMLASNLSHTNTIQHFPLSSFDNSDFCFFLTEYIEFGDFFDLIMSGILDTEILIRTYFHQLIEGIEYMHSQGIAHLDLKPENLMMDSKFTLKIIDFDQAQLLTDKKMTSGGTKGFRAPEVIDGNCVKFEAADVYSAGVILYAFKAQSYPFAEVVDKSNPDIISLHLYSTFVRNNDLYWEKKSAGKRSKGFFSEEFKELVNGMLEYDVDKRFTIKKIKESRWYNGPVLESQNLCNEMEARWMRLLVKG